MTTSYYDTHADAYIEQTLNVDMSSLYKRFLPLIPEGGAILDAGCGSGRDAKAFHSKGFNITAFDASAAMCRSASKLLGKTVLRLKFHQIEWIQEFDGVWACASLLHVPFEELGQNLRPLLRALKLGGALYVSFKYGNGERTHGGRHFLHMNEQTLRLALATISEISFTETWITSDMRPGRGDEAWLNAIVTNGSSVHPSEIDEG